MTKRRKTASIVTMLALAAMLAFSSCTDTEIPQAGYRSVRGNLLAGDTKKPAPTLRIVK